MASLPRAIPQTPLDALRALLASHAEGDPSFAAHLQQCVHELRRQALPELGKKLLDPGAPKGLKRALLGLVAKHDWMEWVDCLRSLLQQETDLGLFDEGCAALGSLATRDACEALGHLKERRTELNYQTILNRELALYQPQQSFDYYLGRLMEGQGNVRLASQGAKMLASMTGAAELPAIFEAHRQGDAVAQRLAVRIIASLKDPQAVAYLNSLVDPSRDEYLDNLLILETLQRIATMPRPSARAELLKRVRDRFEGRAQEALAKLAEVAAQEGRNPGPALEGLRSVAVGPFDEFLLEALTLILEGKVARFSAYCSEQETQVEARQEQLVSLLDQVAEALAFKCSRGEIAREQLLDALGEAFWSKAGGDGLLGAYLSLMPPSDGAALSRILAEPDMERREKCLDVLGFREDDAFVGFFLKAMQDSIVEVGQRAIHHLGKLPSAFPALMALFESGQREQMRQAIRVFGENHMRVAAEPLVEFIQKDVRDDILVEAVEALADIGYPAGTPIYIELLHDGKPLALQLALARALGELKREDASLGLLAKAPQLKHPQVLVLALEGALAAFPDFDHPLPVPHLASLMQLVDRCCDEREGEGQRMRAMLALEHLYVFDQGAYLQLKDRYSDLLFDMRTKESWDRESNDRIAAIVKELARRSDALGLLAKKESGIRFLSQKLPEPGPKRVAALMALRDALKDSELILRPELAQELAELVRGELAKPAVEWRETAHLCEIAGVVRQGELADPIREIYQKASGLGLKSAAREALLRLGLSEADLNKRSPIKSVLILEPSAFFRKRVTSSLSATGAWSLREAGSRQEAEARLADQPVDLLLCESVDGEGDLAGWIEARCAAGACKYVLISTANRDLGSIAKAPWVIGVLYKPYPMGELIHAVES